MRSLAMHFSRLGLFFLILSVAPIHASEITFNGMASFVMGQTLDEDEGTMYGYDDKMGFQENSLFAFQVQADLDEKLSATAQVMAKGREDYQTKFAWAYLKYDINAEWSVKIGRSRAPFYMYSDFLDVGYAYHWITPPDSVYSATSGFDAADGINLNYKTSWGNWFSNATFLLARSDTELNGNGEVTTALVADLISLAWSLNYDWFTVRANYSQADLSLNSAGSDQILAGLAQAGTPQVLLDDFEVQKDPVTFSGIGISADLASFLIVSEISKTELKGSFSTETTEGWYFTGGYRFGDFMAYATYEESTNENSQDPFTPIITYLQGIPGTEQLVGGLSLFQANFPDTIDTTTYSLGLRYNFHSSASFKVEYLERTVESTGADDLKPAAIAAAIDIIF